MGQKSLVSIIMPVYKPNIKYLQKSVNSILSQTYDEIEFIVVFDKSDSSKDDLALETLEQFCDDNRLQLVVNQKRLGLSHCLNYGIRLSKGKFIGRMDCDDISSSIRIQEQLDVLQQESVDLVGCWSHVIDSKDQILGHFTPPFKWKTIRKHILLQNPFIHSSILFNRKIIKKIGLYQPDFEPSEDYEFYLRVFSNGFRGENIPRFLHCWRIHEASVTQNKKWKRSRFVRLRLHKIAFFKYGFNKPFDFLYFLMNPLILFISPSNVLIIKHLFNRYRR